MSVHYKFKSTLEYDTVTFDGLHISVRDLKKAILHQKRIGKNTDFDLQVTNAQTKEVYTDDNALIPKNTSLIVARIPLTAQQKKAWDRSEANQQLAGVTKNIEVLDSSESGVLRLAKAVDLTSLDASEEDKIQAMMTQSTQDYNPSNYIKIRGANQMGEVPPTYRCYKCHQTGHWIKNCPLSANQDPVDYKKSTGIPRSFMVVVDGPSVPGAMMTPTGEFAVPAIDHQAYKEGKKEKPPFQPEPEPVVEKPEIPEDLLCTVCKDLLTDAIMIPCCGNSFCDDCIRTVLLESEDHECPDCKEKDVSPDSLIPNRFLRNAVNNFKNETGYHRTAPKIQQMPVAVPEIPLVTAVPSLVSVMATVSVSNSAIQSTAPPVQSQLAPAPLIATQEQGNADVAAPATFEPVVVAEPTVAQKPIETVNTIPVLGSSGTVVPHHHSANVPVVVTSANAKVLPKEIPHTSAAVAPTKQATPAPAESQVSHIEAVTSHVTVPTTLSSQIVKQQVKVPVSSSGASPAQAASALPSSQGLHKPPPLRVSEHTHLPPQPIYPHAARLSTEDRPGTPTIDERNLEGGASHIVTSLPDTSVPPPNFNPPPPGETSQHYQIETLEPVRPQRAIGMSYRQDHSYGHRNYPPHSQYDHNRSSYHHDSGSGGRSNYSDMDRDGHMMHRGGYRGYRNRGRAMHGGYRGHGHHHQASNINRGVHNGSQSSTIDDPLEAFERMLREKDRKRKLRQPRRSRSFSPRSRSNSRSSRSFSRSRTPTRSRSRSRSRSRTRSRTPRSRTRTPRKRSRSRTKSRTRSPSGSFSISSKSRSRSFSRSPTAARVLHSSPRDRERDRKRDRERDVSPRRRASPHYRSPVPTRPSSPPPRYHTSYKDVRAEFDSSAYYEPEFQQYTTGPATRGGRGGRYRKDYNKDYYDQSYTRYNDRYSNREPRAVESLLPTPPGVTQYDANPPSYRRYNQYDVAPPGTGPDIPGIGSYDKPHYDRGYERPAAHENRPSSTEYLTPPGVDMRSDYAGRECDVAMQSFRDKGVPPSRDREPITTSVLRDARDVGSVGRDNWDRGREHDHVTSRDRDVERERNKDYYEADYRHNYEGKTYNYNSPDRKRRHSTSPARRGGSRDHYSNSEQHRHGRSDGRRKGSQRDGGKENRHSSQQQPVEALEVTGDRGRDHDKDKESQKRERVLVEVRKEPSVDKEKGKKEKDEKSRKDDDDKIKDKKVKEKKKRKKEKDVDGEKLKKKKRKERKDGKKDAADNKTNVAEKARIESQTQAKIAKKEAAVQPAAKPPASKTPAATDNVASKAAQPISVVIGDKKPKPPAVQHSESVVDALYGDMEDTRIDNVVVANYGKVDVLTDGDAVKSEMPESVSDAQAVIDEVKEETSEVVETEEQKGDSLDSVKSNVVLAPLPEPSKWELDDELGDEKLMEEHLISAEDATDKSGNKIVTSEVLKRAENAIFQKAINAIRPIEPAKKPTVGERKVYAASEKEKKLPVEPTVIDTIDITRKVAEKEAREARKTANSIQITIPIAGHVERSVELSTVENAPARKEKPKLDRSKFAASASILTTNQWGEVFEGTSPHRVPVKERLGAKVDTDGDKRREESEREEKSRRQRHRSRSNSREHKQHGSRKGLNLKSAIERKRTVSRSRSRSPYHRKMIPDRKFLEPLKYVDPLVAAMELRYMEPADRRFLDPTLERKYLEHGLRRDARYPEGDRRLMERDIRRPEKHYESERRRERSHSESREREWARSKMREGREHSRHKVKKRTKNRSESRTRKKSTSDRETKRNKKKEKKHKKEKGKKHKTKADKEEKKDLENVKLDEKNELTVEEGKQEATNQASEMGKEKQKQTAVLDTEETGENKEKVKKGNRKNPRLASDRKKSTLDEASFEPDYDLSSSGESEVEDTPADGDKKAEDMEKKPEMHTDDKASPPKKRDRSASTDVAPANTTVDKKRQKIEKEGDKSNEPEAKKGSKGAGGKTSKKREKFSSSDEDSSDDSSDDSESSSGSSSSSDDDSSDGSSIRRRRKKRSSRKHRRKKSKKNRRAETSSDSDSDSDSDDASSSDSGVRRKSRTSKKHKHHSKKSSKKKKKSKHR